MRRELLLAAVKLLPTVPTLALLLLPRSPPGNRKKSHIRKHVAKEDCYIVGHVVNAVKEAAANSVTVHIPCGRSQFKTYKGVLTELYKRLEGIQQYQIFSMDEVSIGVVSCRKEPSDEPVEMNLRRKIDGILTTKEKVVKMMSDHVEVLAPPPPKVEKVKRCIITPGHTSPRSSETIHCTPRPPCGHGSGSKANQDRRGHEDVGPSAEEEPAKKRKAPKK
ncbi:hypothetical protein F444_20863 [Phytophthora nicotianae P1976]|uniref:Uncharacterized protein n=1 Tax=Phytophthora nicotianae P1976 TaxID=1317066 RepID=A0A080Z316_PHYNI|nr:hypothetical protein F444_20863 [Phytophthora nicotianae P1976]